MVVDEGNIFIYVSYDVIELFKIVGSFFGFIFLLVEFIDLVYG